MLLPLRGRYRMVLYKANGDKYGFWGNNLVVDAGKNLVAEIIENNSGTPASPSHVAIGESGIAVADSQTTLQGTEHHRDAASLSRVDNELTLDVTISHTGADITVREAGIFNAAAAGTMLARWLTQEFVMGNGDSVDITWTLTFG